MLDTARGVSAKVQRLREEGEREALQAVAAENDFEHKRRKEELHAVGLLAALFPACTVLTFGLCCPLIPQAEMHVSSHREHPERGVALRLDPVRGNPTLGFVHGVRGDGGSPRAAGAPRGARTPMSPAARPVARNRSFNTPASAVAFEELQKLKAEVQRLKWKLKQTEGAGDCGVRRCESRRRMLMVGVLCCNSL